MLHMFFFAVHNAPSEVRRMVDHDCGGRGDARRPRRGPDQPRQQQRHPVRVLHARVRHVHEQVGAEITHLNLNCIHGWVDFHLVIQFIAKFWLFLPIFHH